MTNNSRRFEKGGRPDWPSFRIRNISPELWERVKTRAVYESKDGNPRLNGVLLHLLQVYAEQGLPPLAGFPKAGAGPTVSPMPPQEGE
jgi:hypothetical protein